ncbi:2Fe-2S iron-sulfur cluster-binding protein [Glaciecola sp. MF2-115]|uniref:2Fe-2S iron-sulfur cluster-binding protein n=1 Tax=Glaciecola sp. MF2-115 TaxID=3384827 RepID=UPI0039A18A2E
MSFKQIHKWVSLVVFAQLLIWLATGFLLGKVDSNTAGGRDTLLHQSSKSMAHFYEQVDVQENEQESEQINEENNKLPQPFVSMNSLLKDFPSATQVRLTYLLNHPVYEIKLAAGAHAFEASDYRLVDALSGELIDLSNPKLASKNEDLIYALAFQSHKEYVARLSNKSPDEVLGVALNGLSWSNDENSLTQFKSKESAQLLHPPIEDLARERNAVWQVNLNDPEQTSIYIRAQTGQVIAHVNEVTRWRDLLLMLHFMDYTQEGNFNNWFIKIFALLTLLLAGTGVWCLGRLFKDGQLKITWFTGDKHFVIQVAQTKGAKNAESVSIKAHPNSTVLAGLLDNDIDIQAICGGGGECGTCKFKGSTDIPITQADRKHIKDSDLDFGYRLACQHHLKEVDCISLHSLF